MMSSINEHRVMSEQHFSHQPRTQPLRYVKSNELIVFLLFPGCSWKVFLESNRNLYFRVIYFYINNIIGRLIRWRLYYIIILYYTILYVRIGAPFARRRTSYRCTSWWITICWCRNSFYQSGWEWFCGEDTLAIHRKHAKCVFQSTIRTSCRIWIWQQKMQ